MPQWSQVRARKDYADPQQQEQAHDSAQTRISIMAKYSDPLNLSQASGGGLKRGCVRMRLVGGCKKGKKRGSTLRTVLLWSEDLRKVRSQTMPSRRRAAAHLVAAVCLVLGLALVIDQHDTRIRRSELTFWDGASSDEPGYAEEASQQIDTGLYGYHLGYWEMPGYWNNRGLADGAESQMDARMFADAANNNYFHTGGADFMDTGSLYNDATDADSVSLDGTYSDAWPGTGEGLLGYDDIESENDAYDGQLEMDPLDTEATTDAAVSGNDVGGFKQVGSKQSQLLAQLKCERCYDGPDCVAGCRSSVKGVRSAPRAAQAAPKKKRNAASSRHHAAAAEHARKLLPAAKKKVSLAAQGVQAETKPAVVPFVLAGFDMEGLRKMSNPGLMCGRYACAVGGLWGKACGCTAAEEAAEREEEEEKAVAVKRAAAEEEAEEEEVEEEKQQWLGLQGLVLNASPLAERWMPEQHNEVPAFAQNWNTFWDSGHKLKQLGFNV